MYGHLWSLSVEEQFYLVWPFVVLVAGRRAKDPAPAIAALAAVGMAATLVARSGGYPGFAHISRLYGTDFVADQLLAGCGLGALVWMIRSRGPAERASRVAARTFPAAAISLAATALVLHPGRGESATLRWFATWGLSLTALASAAAIGHLVLNPASRAARALSHPVLTWIGERSYSLYLWHILAFALFRDDLGTGRGALRTAAQLGLATAAAAASFRLVERPARATLRRRLEGHPAAGKATPSRTRSPQRLPEARASNGGEAGLRWQE